MLNPPLSLLSDDLLISIVEHVAKLPLADKNLYNLSLADRAFTQSCQKYFFRDLKLSSKQKIAKKLKETKKIFEEKPSLANQVRMVELLISRRSSWVLKDYAFISILQLLSKSLMPPHELHFGGHMSSFAIKDPILIVRQFAQSFFSQTLTILRLTDCANIPLPLFLICPRLREVFLNNIRAIDNTYNEYPDNLCSVREAPPLEVLDYRDSHSLVKQMINPPSRFNTPVVLWSNLRILMLSPHEKKGMAYLQPILDAACNTSEELYLTSIAWDKFRQLSLAGLVNLGNLSHLHVFSLYVIIGCNENAAILHDISMVLGTIPKSNDVTNLCFDFKIVGWYPFRGCLDQDWVGMFNEVIRIADGKPLELELQMVVYNGEPHSHVENQLYRCIMEKAAPLLDYPKICTHFWNPTFEARGLGLVSRGQVRSRCRR